MFALRPQALHTTCHRFTAPTARIRRHDFFLIRSQSSAAQSRTFITTLNLRYAKPAPPKVPPVVAEASTEYEFPPRLLFYYAGKRTIYLGTMKLYSAILFSYCTLIVAPGLYSSEELRSSVAEKMGLAKMMETLPDQWIIPAIAVIGGALPLAFMQYLSPPYVTHAYLHLAPFARYSRQHLKRYLQKLPKDAEMELATIRWFGRPKLTKVKVGDLRLSKERWGCVNVSAPGKKQGRWDKFYLDFRGSPAGAAIKVPEVVGEVGKALVRWEEEKGL